MAVLCNLAALNVCRRAHWPIAVCGLGHRLDDRRRDDNAEYYWSPRGYSAGLYRIPVISAVSFLATAKTVTAMATIMYRLTNSDLRRFMVCLRQHKPIEVPLPGNQAAAKL